MCMLLGALFGGMGAAKRPQNESPTQGSSADAGASASGSASAAAALSGDAIGGADGAGGASGTQKQQISKLIVEIKGVVGRMQGGGCCAGGNGSGNGSGSDLSVQDALTNAKHDLAAGDRAGARRETADAGRLLGGNGGGVRAAGRESTSATLNDIDDMVAA